MGVYLTIGGVDVSSFMTANKYSAESSPVYDEESSFTNIYGERVRKQTGRTVTVKAVLSDVDDATAEALSAALRSGSASVTYSAPEMETAEFEAVKFKLSLDRVFGGCRFWTAETELRAAFIPCGDCL